jgi:hypothetical protein
VWAIYLEEMRRSTVSDFDRSVFALELDELELQEAMRTLEQLMKSSRLKNSTKVSLRFALDALKAEAA